MKGRGGFAADFASRVSEALFPRVFCCVVAQLMTVMYQVCDVHCTALWYVYLIDLDGGHRRRQVDRLRQSTYIYKLYTIHFISYTMANEQKPSIPAGPSQKSRRTVVRPRCYVFIPPLMSRFKRRTRPNCNLENSQMGKH